jgi:DNA-binding NtrC family response regulator
MERDCMKNTMTVLVVDDEERMRELLGRILARDGYSVLTAEDGCKALELIRAERVDLIISDVRMPHCDGFELLKTVKREHPHIGVIMMTAHGDTYTVKDVLLLGADEYIAKPFKSYEVSLIVERAYWRLLSESGASS